MDSAPHQTAAGEIPVLRLAGISKYFPGVIANEAVDLDVRPGEILALLGENGAGKSTLMNVVTGIYRPDAGEIIVDGYGVSFATPHDAIRSGIGMVHQHFKLVPAFTVAENIHLGWDETPRRITRDILETRTKALSEQFGIPVRPSATVADLSAGEQQKVEILRVLSRKARLLILDEPTAVLTPDEARDLFRALRAFREKGNAVIIISHKLDEVMDISDRVSVLRGGRNAGTFETRDCSPPMLAATMVGREIVRRDLRARRPDAKPVSENPVISLVNAGVRDSRGVMSLRDVTLALHGGEILGVAGVAGSGQKELTGLLTGLCTPAQGEVLIDGQKAPAGAAAFAEAGIGHIPQDRLHSALAPSLGIADNMALREYRQAPVGGDGMYRSDEAADLAKEIVEVADVKIPDLATPIRNLSGGNQQRLVARREIRIAQKALVAAYPGRGLDIGAVATMHRYFSELRDAGAGVVVISEDLEELLNLSDRIAVLCAGRLMAVLPAQSADIDTIGMLMGGRTAPDDATDHAADHQAGEG
ncbi:ABC transporter ATP-binding protein [Acetobacter sp. AN02]|uniref:ABC transporter ATP-binding protein n=1 Tax=Acetobacter sp. AN02 TaxID=2894186 RepID=UPI00243453CC|nr:ABC transporter ATP-binding protein [Acetobacter sp. AN02]MDG6095287.1 ABC transporter ATP-binding protein [Acetobacter sp. AN02]